MRGCRAVPVDSGQRRAQNVFVVIQKAMSQPSDRDRLERRSYRDLAASQLGVPLAGDSGGFGFIPPDPRAHRARARPVIDVPRSVMQVIGNAAYPLTGGPLASTRHDDLPVRHLCTNCAPGEVIRRALKTLSRFNQTA
jgi:hypothetical protein